MLKQPEFTELLPDEIIVGVFKDDGKGYFSARRPEGIKLKDKLLADVKGSLFVTNKTLIFEDSDGGVVRRYAYGLLESTAGNNTKYFLGTLLRSGWLKLTMIGGRTVEFECYKGGDIAERINVECTNGEFDKFGDAEIINTCNRCDKVWFMNPTELDEFEKGRVSIRASGADALQVGLVMLHFGVAASQRLSTEKTISREGRATRYAAERARLEAKFICPDCNSSDITRNISKKGERIDRLKRKFELVEGGTDGDDKLTKLKELQMMYKDGLIDKEEFSKLKKDIIG